LRETVEEIRPSAGVAPVARFGGCEGRAGGDVGTGAAEVIRPNKIGGGGGTGFEDGTKRVAVGANEKAEVAGGAVDGVEVEAKVKVVGRGTCAAEVEGSDPNEGTNGEAVASRGGFAAALATEFANGGGVGTGVGKAVGGWEIAKVEKVEGFAGDEEKVGCEVVEGGGGCRSESAADVEGDEAEARLGVIGTLATGREE
jgi:hypothetical protein